MLAFRPGALGADTESPRTTTVPGVAKSAAQSGPAAAGVAPARKANSSNDPEDWPAFVAGLSVSGAARGKGFQGVVKRHNFGGVGQSTHGQHNRQRHPGAIGACSYPARVFKGLKMAGRTGGQRVKVTNLKVMRVYPDENLVVISGAVPGAKNSYVIIEK